MPRLERFTSAYGEMIAFKRQQPNRTNMTDPALLEADEKSSTERARDWA